MRQDAKARRNAASKEIGKAKGAKDDALAAKLMAEVASLKDVLAENLTAAYEKTTHGDTQASKERFITEVYDEVQGLPPVVDGKRTMPKHP